MIFNKMVQPWLRLTLILISLGALVGLLNVAAPASAMTGDRAGLRAQPVALANSPTGAASVFGIDEGGALYGNPTGLSLAAATGANWVRTSVEWDGIEQVRGTYDFTYSDIALNGLLAAGLNPIVYLGVNPSWAANTNCGPVDTRDPTLVASFANVMGALAKRYPAIKIWALYNEIDYADNTANNTGGCFGSTKPGGLNHNKVQDSDELAIMLAAAWKAVHTNNPNALLANGAVAFDNFNKATAPSGYPGGGKDGLFNYNFTTALYTYMAKHPLPKHEKYMDLQLLNYYDIYGSAWWEKVAAGHGVQAKAAALRSRMKSAGIPIVPLFVSETGEPSIKSWIGLSGQARCLDIAMVRGAATKLKGMIWWTFRDFSDSDPFPRNTWKYGIVDQNQVPKPSYTSLQTLATELNGYKYKKTLSDTTGFGNVEAYQFKNKKQIKVVVWSNSLNTPSGNAQYQPKCSWQRNPRIATFSANRLRVVTYMNKAKNIKDNSKKDKNKAVGQIGITVATDPQIVQINP